MLRRAPLVLLLCGTMLNLAWLAPARAQDDDQTRGDIAMQNQILELRHDLDTLRDQVAAGAGNSGGSYQPAPAPSGQSGTSGDILPQLLDRVQQLEDQVRTLQGQVDEANNKLQQQGADVTKQLGDLSFRVQTLEGGKGGTPAAIAPGDDSGAPALSPPPGNLGAAPPSPAPTTPLRAASLQQGYAALARRDYPTAESAARLALANPRSPKAYDAQFLLAQALAGQHSYQPAALAYDDTYNKSRRGAHAQDALLGLAGTLASLGEKPAACATLDKLHAEFPGARADVHSAAQALARRADCR